MRLIGEGDGIHWPDVDEGIRTITIMLIEGLPSHGAYCRERPFGVPSRARLEVDGDTSLLDLAAPARWMLGESRRGRWGRHE